MLWRVREIVRHCHRSALLYFKSSGSSPSLIPHSAQPHRRAQWISAAYAFKTLPAFRPQAPALDVEQDQRRPAIRARDYLSPNVKQRTPLTARESFLRGLPQPPVNVVEMVDDLFQHWRAGTCSVEGLKKRVGDTALLEHLLNRDKTRELAALMVNTSVPQRAQHVLQLAHYLGCPLKQNAYEGVAYQLAQTRQWAEVPSLVALGKRQTGRTTARLLNWRARALAEISHFGLVNALEDFEEENIQPNRRTFQIVISSHVRNRNLAKAKECLEWMEQAGFPIDASTHSLITSAYRSLGPDKKIQAQAIASLQDMSQESATMVINSLIQLALDSHDADGALRYLSYFNGPVVQPASYPTPGPSTLHRSGGPHSHSNTSSPTIPAPTCQRTPQVLSPNSITFTIFLNYMARIGDLSRALQVIERMNESGVAPDSTVVSALIRVYCAVDDYPVALRLAASVCQSVPGSHTLFRDLGLDHELTGQADFGFDPAGLSPTTEIFNALLKGVLTYRGLNGMRNILKIMRSAGIEPNHETMELFVSHLDRVEKARPRELMRVLRLLSKNSSDSRIMLRHVHIILGSILRKQIAITSPRGWGRRPKVGQPEIHNLSALSNELPDAPFDPIAGIKLPAKVTFSTMLRTVVQSLAARRIRADRATVAMRLRMDAVVKQDMDAAWTTFQTMLNRGMHPNEYHFAAMMEGYTRAGDMKAAEDVFQSATDAGIKPNVVLLTILIVGYARQGNPRQASRVFEDMVAAGIYPDVASVDALASAYYAAGAIATAKHVLITLWSNIAPFPPELHDTTLKQLARAFRKLGGRTDRTPIQFTKQQRRMVRWKVKRILSRWERYFVRGPTRGRLHTLVHNTPNSTRKL